MLKHVYAETQQSRARAISKKIWIVCWFFTWVSSIQSGTILTYLTENPGFTTLMVIFVFNYEGQCRRNLCVGVMWFIRISLIWVWQIESSVIWLIHWWLNWVRWIEVLVVWLMHWESMCKVGLECAAKTRQTREKPDLASEGLGLNRWLAWKGLCRSK